MNVIIKENLKEFLEAANHSLSHDQKERGGDSIAGSTVSERLDKAMRLLSEDEAYAGEYHEFVEEMSYVPDEERIEFNDALSIMNRLVRELNR